MAAFNRLLNLGRVSVFFPGRENTGLYGFRVRMLLVAARNFFKALNGHSSADMLA
jgi:hypothetical protein